MFFTMMLHSEQHVLYSCRFLSCFQIFALLPISQASSNTGYFQIQGVQVFDEVTCNAHHESLCQSNFQKFTLSFGLCEATRSTSECENESKAKAIRHHVHREGMDTTKTEFPNKYTFDDGTTTVNLSLNSVKSSSLVRVGNRHAVDIGFSSKT